MPNRLMVWNAVAAELGGTASVDTALASSDFGLTGTHDGFEVSVRGRSVPYSETASWTRIELRGAAPFGFGVRLYRDQHVVPLFKRLGGRDVRVGLAGFDANWVVRTRDEAMAQAWFSHDVARLVQAVPARHPSLSLGFYSLQLHGRTAEARSVGFEEDAERMLAAVSALSALANRPKQLIEEWQAVAQALDGKLEHGRQWKPDGSVRIVVPLARQRVLIRPQAVRSGWRRRRLFTRVTCERTVGSHGRFVIAARGAELSKSETRGLYFVESHDAGDLLQLFSEELDEPGLEESLGQALEAARPFRVRGKRKEIEIDLEGHVADWERLMACMRAAAQLANPSGRDPTPYR